MPWLGSGSALTSPLDVNGGGCGIVSGCTNPNATNFNADANVEDGSCEFSCEYLLSVDSYYDSWDNGFSNYYCDYYMSTGSYTIEELEGYGYACECVEEPVYGCTDDTADNFNADATVDDGTCEYSCAEGVSVFCDGGSWQSEVSWDLDDGTGNIIANGGAPYSGQVAVGFKINATQSSKI